LLGKRQRDKTVDGRHDDIRAIEGRKQASSGCDLAGCQVFFVPGDSTFNKVKRETSSIVGNGRLKQRVAGVNRQVTNLPY
jgi:hypothetical protein